MAGPLPHPDGRRVVLLVAHGSRNPAACTAAHRRSCSIAAAGDDGSATAPLVRPAYLEISEPSIPTAIDEAIAQGATSVRLLPHFLSPGNHVLVDLPAIAAAAIERHPGTPIELAEHLGADPGLVALLATRAQAD